MKKDRLYYSKFGWEEPGNLPYFWLTKEQKQSRLRYVDQIRFANRRGYSPIQTFLPYSSFTESAKCLDNKRLGKQRVEAYQILKTLLQGPYQCTIRKDHFVDIQDYQCELGCRECGAHVRRTPWYNHPAVQMWKGYEVRLCEYIRDMCDEWFNRGFKDSIKNKVWDLTNGWYLPLGNNKLKWLGDNRFHSSHRSNLLRKGPKYYSKFGWEEPDNLPYFWPTKEGY